jgi:hypothetical protein
MNRLKKGHFSDLYEKELALSRKIDAYESKKFFYQRLKKYLNKDTAIGTNGVHDNGVKDSSGSNLGKRAFLRNDSDFSEDDSNLSTCNLPLKAIRGNLVSGYSTYDSGNDDTPDDSENEEQLEKLKEFVSNSNNKLNQNVGSVGLRTGNPNRSSKGGTAGNRESDMGGLGSKNAGVEVLAGSASKNDRSLNTGMIARAEADSNMGSEVNNQLARLERSNKVSQSKIFDPERIIRQGHWGFEYRTHGQGHPRVGQKFPETGI